MDCWQVARCLVYSTELKISFSEDDYLKTCCSPSVLLKMVPNQIKDGDIIRSGDDWSISVYC